jgi:hypothetical protein
MKGVPRLWRADIAVTFNIIDTNCRRICVVQLVGKRLSLLLLCVYIPYEGSDDDLVELLLILNDIITSHQDCQIYIGCYFKVDVTRATLEIFVTMSLSVG